ncbi:gamma-glutamyl-gamma-aminobutyrate hydrolase family protein [Kamptonema cortianum]|nr:gamma-glutamyl-gamma-aminobutyrate hydrolase family protein [Geitlerinema splendidum]MDK3161067.1 gamma-glutamyl-gamma-aminobutyrate hydrolase family protein [Kamptonema cortianum]
MTKPIIGITVSAMKNPRTNEEHGRYFLDRAYIDRVVAAGGVPVLIPPGSDAQTLATILDGWLIPGGGDFDASLWGEDTHPEAGLEYSGRTETELQLYKSAPANLPILGICYGCQLVNIAQGGTIIQHLPDVLGNDSHRGDPIQDYTIEPGSQLGKVLGSSARGKSWHHQAVGKLGQDLKAVAWHEDGTIEGIEGTGERWFLGVQWHPERTDVPESAVLFDAFIKAARAFKESKAGVATV